MEEKIIVAAIVSQEQPPRVVADLEGNLPEMRYERSHGTVEDTLYVLGRTVVKGIVSIDHAMPLGDKRLYQTKPVANNVLLDEQYAWVECPAGIELK